MGGFALGDHGGDPQGGLRGFVLGGAQPRAWLPPSAAERTTRAPWRYCQTVPQPECFVTISNGRSHRDQLHTFQTADLRRGLWELAATAVPFALLWAAVFVCLTRGWWWGLALTPAAAALLVRLFMVQHDCGHQAFLPDPRANGWLGRGLGVLTATPYEYWRRTHAIHHATSGDLDRRDLGAIEMLTVAEYRALRPLARAAYRLYRHPAIMLGMGPAYMFLLQHRLPVGLMREGWAWRSVMGCTLGLVVLAAPFALTGTLGPFLATLLPIMVMAATFGVWLFYVQHSMRTHTGPVTRTGKPSMPR